MAAAAPLILSLLMLATVALGWGGVWLIAKGRDRKRGVLMLIAAAVMLANVLIWAWPAHGAPIASPLPSEVRSFVARRDSCEHWSGEEPYDRQRAAEIAHAVNRDCPGNDRKLARLRARYAGRADVMAALADRRE